MDVNEKSYGHWSNEDLQKLIEGLQKLVEELRRCVAEHARREKELLEQLEESQRKSHRQATPYSTGERKKNPKCPGRKRGEGPFTYRQEPAATEPAKPVQVETRRCTCGGEFQHSHVERVTNTELPPVPAPIVKAYDVEVCVCARCGQVVRGQHPEVAKDQYGASAHRYGPRARAAAHVLHYQLGVTARKTPQVLKALTGLEIGQSAITQDALRQAENGPVGEVYEDLRFRVGASKYVHTDDTGWKVNGEPAQMMVFETTGEDPVSVFQIRSQHRNEEVRELVPSGYAGTMTTDRGKSYDAEELAGVKQNKCVAHLKRNVKTAQAQQPAGARSFGNRLLAILEMALGLWHDFHEGHLSLPSYQERGRQILEQLTQLLRPRNLKDKTNRRLLKSLAQQHRLGHLLRFLEDPNIEPTNNRSERALRLAVIIRKVSQCSKSSRGAKAQAAFQSVLRTLACRGIDAIKGLTSILLGLNPLARAAPAAD